ncbi:MAG: ergothioneine biosynthesis protein EgtC [Symplocastrum torsivum CPER-KK1]|jgi:glutamine amidotransferase|uniref:Ergothioneine biosynthesis protein EgtC n=1 Tax=Symplocastrum torsivum CPER-KK1 TaxID=450513 RepID=A0A951PR40_9CYAN|nr:ergothioneine biosynthesis protein EgtC [Symplocastrum torsivum CPER-KK1]
MCRLLGYLGSAIQFEQLLYKPEHSLIVQAYQPREMTAGVLNVDGFGIGWYNRLNSVDPFTYKSTLPIWHDTNLPQLSRYIESGCMLGYVRSATPGMALNLSNCQPFQADRLLFIHNGYINNFRKTLYKPIRDRVNDEVYQSVQGSTDSEHIFALILNELLAFPDCPLEKALHTTLMTLTELAKEYQTSFSANLIISDGKRLVASRYAYNAFTPTLYWVKNGSYYPNAVIVASEPLFVGKWNSWKSCPKNSLLSVGENLEVQIEELL